MLDSGPYEEEVDRLRQKLARAADEMTAQTGAAMKKLEVQHIKYMATVQSDLRRLKTQVDDKDFLMKALKDEHAVEIRALKKSLGGGKKKK